MECSEPAAGCSSPAKQLQEVKSPRSERASSPETNCAICLGNPQNKSFTDSCLHQFCFTCLLEWSKVKAECPLCKQSFTSIIHTVRSIEDYEQYYLHPREQARIPAVEEAIWPRSETPFRYRTTMTSILEYYIRFDDAGTHVIPSVPPTRPFRNWRRRRQYGTSEYRRNIYDMNLWVQRMRDVTGRHRESSPEFYRLNPAQVHRLVPWLNRELTVLIQSGDTNIQSVMTLITSLIKEHPIRSRQFRDALVPFIGNRTDHFIHEFHSFATSVYDMIGYDRHSNYVDYFYIAHELDSSSSSSSDSDVQIVGENTSVDPPSSSVAYDEPGPSIEVMSESDTDDCLIVGTVKPRHERTPEIITLDSEAEVENVASDVCEVDNSNPGPSCSYKTRAKVQEKRFSFKNNYPGSDSSVSSVIIEHRSNRRKKHQLKTFNSHPRIIWCSDSSTSTYSDDNDSSWSNRKQKKNLKSKKKKVNKKKELTRKKHSSKDSKRKNKSTEKHWKKKICHKSNSTDSDDSGSLQLTRRRKTNVLISSPEPESSRPLNDHDYPLTNPYTTSDLQKFVNGRPRPKLRSVVVKYESNQRNGEKSSRHYSSSNSTSENDVESNSVKMNKWRNYRESGNSSVDSSSRNLFDRTENSRADQWLDEPSTSSGMTWLDRHYIDTLSSLNPERYNLSHNYRFNRSQLEEQSSSSSSRQNKRKRSSADRSDKSKKSKTITSSDF